MDNALVTYRYAAECLIYNEFVVALVPRTRTGSFYHVLCSAYGVDLELVPQPCLRCYFTSHLLLVAAVFVLCWRVSVYA